MKTIMVTGGAGFIGSHLVDRLLASEDNRVVCVDNFDPFYDPRLKKENLREALQNSRFQLATLDICDRIALQELFCQTKPQQVVHLAARAGVRPSLENPVAYYKTNVEGTLHVLECARESGVRKIIFGSSSSVYGVSSSLPFTESDPLHCPISPYAVTKITAESLCRAFQRLYGMSIICLRFFTVYGPRQRPEMAIAKFARGVLQGRVIDLYGDGSSRRDYTYVTDIVDAILSALKKPLEFEIVNVGNAKAIGLGELVDMLAAQTKKKVSVRRLSNRPGDVPVTFASLAKARRLLGYRAKVNIRQGIAKYLEWLTGQGIP